MVAMRGAVLGMREWRKTWICGSGADGTGVTGLGLWGSFVEVEGSFSGDLGVRLPVNGDTAGFAVSFDVDLRAEGSCEVVSSRYSDFVRRDSAFGCCDKSARSGSGLLEVVGLTTNAGALDPVGRPFSSLSEESMSTTTGAPFFPVGLAFTLSRDLGDLPRTGMEPSRSRDSGSTLCLKFEDALFSILATKALSCSGL